MLNEPQVTYIALTDMGAENGDSVSKVHGANMGPTWGRQAPCGPHENCYLGDSVYAQVPLSVAKSTQGNIFHNKTC